MTNTTRLRNGIGILGILVIGAVVGINSAAAGPTDIMQIHTTVPEEDRMHYATSPQLTPDGTYTVFSSPLDTVTGGDTNGAIDIFQYDASRDRSRIISVATDNTQGDNDSFDASVSGDSELVTFTSLATTLVPSDTNGVSDVFLRDVRNRTTTRISEVAGVGGNDSSFGAVISEDRSTIAFTSAANNLLGSDTDNKLDVYLYDVATGTLELASQIPGGAKGTADSYAPSISADGTIVAFVSKAANLAANDTNNDSDIYVLDRIAGTLTRISNTPGGQAGDGFSVAPAVSADGSTVAFMSTSSDLVAGDTNGFADLFIYDVTSGTLTRVGTAHDGGATDNHASYVRPALSVDGNAVYFTSAASNLVATDGDTIEDSFVYDQSAQTITRMSDAVNAVATSAAVYYVNNSGAGTYITNGSSYPASESFSLGVASVSGDYALGGIDDGTGGNGGNPPPPPPPPPPGGPYETLAENVVWANEGGIDLEFSLYHPDSASNASVVVLVQGGGFQQAATDGIHQSLISVFTDAGYALAVSQQRSRIDAQWPAQMHDLNGFIRFLRANAATYSLDTTNIAVMGASSGGIIAGSQATTEDNALWEGTVGGNTSESSDSATTILVEGAYVQNQLDNLSNGAVNAAKQLMGCGRTDPCPEREELTADKYLDASDDPILIIHGDQDTTVPVTQATELDSIMTTAGHPHDLELVPGVGHSFRDLLLQREAEIAAWLDSYIAIP